MTDLDLLAQLEEELRGTLARGKLDLTVEFGRETKTGRITVHDSVGGTVADIRMDTPEAMTMILARLVVLGFRAATSLADAVASPPQLFAKSATPTDVLVTGVDGFRKGWVAVSLDPSGDLEVSVHPTIVEVLSLRAHVIAIDIPIDPLGLGARPADSSARGFVGSRSSSVFSTPPRAALESPTFAKANEVARSITGKGISRQAFALGRKILEVHGLADVDERVIEMHPEVSFCALAGAPLPESKHTAAGLARRRALLLEAGIDPPAAFPGLPEADLLDAAVGAWTAARYARREARAFPPGHTERLGAIWA